MMIEPAQVGARVLEASLLSRFHSLVSMYLACLTHRIGACVIGLFGGDAAVAFALLHGAGNGILTIPRGTLPLAIFGPENFPYRLGLIGAPSRICQAFAPRAFGLLNGKGRGHGFGGAQHCRVVRPDPFVARADGGVPLIRASRTEAFLCW
jgi:hypothetical protein